MKTGLLFGSFDPFHIGHLSMAISALNSKEIDKVLIVPAYQNPPAMNSSSLYHTNRHKANACSNFLRFFRTSGFMSGARYDIIT